MNNVATRSRARFVTSSLADRSTRRVLVLAWALCCLGFVALGAAEVRGVVWFVLIALTLIADVALYLATRRITDRPTSSLDERELLVRNRAYRSAYIALFLGLIVVVGGSLLLFYSGLQVLPAWSSHPAAHPEVLSGFGLAALQTASLLPTATVAWSEPDESDD